ncbi:MAG: hypothetical protein ACT4P5_05815 [Armatimonadota bacterium]
MARFREEGSVLAGTQRGTCEGFAIELSIDGDERPEDIAKLMGLAHGMCFTEDTLSRVVKLTASHLFNGQPINVALVEP